ncbi:MAG: hypothetical protein JWN29_3918 [Acidimicrobiales bacterium]|nr:hypothetical protein [Acidimicrobiales bacterium]
MNDVIERDLILTQPVERVWAALTDPKELGSWFPDRVELDVRPGGEGTFTFDMDGGEHVAAVVVEAVEPMSRFAFWWGDVGNVAEQRTLVDFTLEPVEGGTRLHLVESGFAKMANGDDMRKGNEDGWTVQLGKLPGYLAA